MHDYLIMCPAQLAAAGISNQAELPKLTMHLALFSNVSQTVHMIAII